MSPCNRRDVCKAMVGLAGLAALDGCLPDVSPARSVRVPVPGPDLTYDLDLSLAPELASPGGAVTVSAGRRTPAVMVANSGGSYVGFASACTHAGCPVGFSVDKVICPCHLSEFDLQGNPTHPPATKPLRQYPVHDQGNGHLKIEIAIGDGTFPQPVDGKLTLALGDYPALATPGSAVIGQPASILDTLAVILEANGTFSTVSAICTHAGCVMGFSHSADDLECDCHGSRFSPDGSVLQGPARTPLKQYATTATGDTVVITLS